MPFRPRLHEYVFIENDTTVLHLHIVFVSFSYRFQPSIRKRWKLLKTVKTSEKLMFACQDNLNNLWLLLNCFQKFPFSVKAVRLHETISLRFQIFPLWRPFSKVIVFSVNDHRFWSFSCICKVKTQIKVCGFDENDMDTYSCRRGLGDEKIHWKLQHMCPYEHI